MKDRSPQQGIALVITLIMLSVTLIMAVAFLAISTRERGSVTTGTDSTHARLAADSALAQAEAQIAASIIATGNPYNFGLQVSTNYLTPNGFITESGAGVSGLTNVNYYYTNGTFLSPGDLAINVANLQYLPRAPVFVLTNSPTGGGYDFRYYLDLNRNGQFDDTGSVTNWQFSNGALVPNGFVPQTGDPQWIGVLEHPDQPHGPNNRFIARYCYIAVPVGNTLDANAIYNDATMAGSATLADTTMQYGGHDGFLRNEGVGTWELNLAAFLADLNTNEWDSPTRGGIYNYKTPYSLNANGTVSLPNNGAAFEDALELLRYRYNGSIFTETNIGQYFNYPTLANNYIDMFSDGPLMSNNFVPPANYPLNINYAKAPWLGSANTNLFFSLSDFFHTNVTETTVPTSLGDLGFTDHLLHAGTNTYNTPTGPQLPTYDRYTFYRMLAQLGTDTTPESGKMNLNYVNVDNNGSIVPGAETNYLRWNASQFFTNAADRLLRAYTAQWFNTNYIYTNSIGNRVTDNNFYFTNTFGAITNTFGAQSSIYTGPFSLTNIPVWVNGQFVYSSAVNRLLQLAANMYDASTNSFYPSAFRPTFIRDNLGNIFINGYQQVANISGGIYDYQLATPQDISALVLGNLPVTGTGSTVAMNNVNVYGVPWIVGAKKGLPNFNQLYSLNTVQVTRKLQFNRPAVGSQLSDYTTNIMYVVSITNAIGMSLWNSYYSNYYGNPNFSSPNMSVYMQDSMNVVLTTNTAGIATITTPVIIFPFYTNITTGWTGSGWNPNVFPPSAATPNPYSYVTYTLTNVVLPTAQYMASTRGFDDLTNNPTWETTVTASYNFPPYQLMTTNRAQAYILDGPAGDQHVVDYVQFSGPSTNRNIFTDLADPPYVGGTNALMWSTNGYTGRNLNIIPQVSPNPSWGEYNQIMVSEGNQLAPPNSGVWSSSAIATADTSPQAQQAFFKAFFATSPTYTYGPSNYSNLELTNQAPFTPTRTMYNFTLWEANDPLVHYISSDLNYVAPGQIGLQLVDVVPALFSEQNLLNLNQPGLRYQPWGLNAQMNGVPTVDTSAYNLAFKDPLIWDSDSWQFPTNLFPNVGWLGRVHRGTPWQTVYLKASDVLGETASAYNIGTNTWLAWSGNTANWFDANNAAPVHDRLLFDLFTTAPNDNATVGQLSINQTNLAAWSAVFSGLPVFTNIAGTNLTVFQPAGLPGTNYVPNNGSNYLGYIWNSIEQTRTNTYLNPLQEFAHLGDLLATPALTVLSPYLPLSDPVQIQYYNLINDNMYEWLPQHTLSQLKVGTPRYVIYCYGQALKPAPNGIMTSGPYPLMCTNYQIVAESAVRAVVQVDNATGSNPQIILKNVNPLPPDQ